MVRLRGVVTVVAVGVALAIATGCAGSVPSIALPSASGNPPVSVPPADEPVPGGSPVVGPSAAVSLPPVAEPSPSVSAVPPRPPSPRPTAVPTTWSEPEVVRSGECAGLSALIDAAGDRHVAAVCDGGIRYLASSARGAWTETPFIPPVNRVELDPILALDGDELWVAYSRLAPVDGGCGDDGLDDIGVYTRFRHLPSGTWSEPVQIGGRADRVQAFRVVDGVRHLTITTDNGAGPIYYETQAGPVVSQVMIPEAISTTLRVGDDGYARVAWTTGHALRYARIDGAHLSTITVAGTDRTYLQAPSLVLGPGDRAYLLWLQNTDGGGGCAGPESGPLDGVYVATDAGGRWTSTRLSARPSQGSLSLDAATGRLDAVVSNEGTMTRYSSRDGASWTSSRIPGTTAMGSPVVRVDPTTGRLGLFVIPWSDSSGIVASQGPEDARVSPPETDYHVGDRACARARQPALPVPNWRSPASPSPGMM
ncbi:MAG: hypothetical protein H0U52_16160 [Chloroflexi bacterium]|nr:hypothetical protein [Chloroflexota bacterium]